MQIAHIQHHIAWCFFGLVNIEGNVASDHHAGKLAFINGINVYCAYVLAQTDDRAVICRFLYLLELMGYEDDALPIAGEVMHDADKFNYLLRGERGGRLIKDEDVRAAVERLEYFHTLLHTDGNILYPCVRINGQAVALRDLLNVLAGFSHVERNALFRLSSENDILRDRERLDKHEMLMHHSDTGVYGVAGIVHLNLFPVDENISRGRLEHTVKLVHQRGLAGTVFSEDYMDLSLVDSKVYPVVRHKIAKLLDNVAHFYNGLAHVHIFFRQIDRPPNFFIFGLAQIRLKNALTSASCLPRQRMWWLLMGAVRKYEKSSRYTLTCVRHSSSLYGEAVTRPSLTK